MIKPPRSLVITAAFALPRSLFHPELPKARSLSPKNWGRGQGEGVVAARKTPSAEATLFPTTTPLSSTLKTTPPPLTPALLPASGAREDVFGPSFTQDQTAPVRSPSPPRSLSHPELPKARSLSPKNWGRGQGEGVVAARKTPSAKVALFSKTTPPPSTP